MQNAINDKLRAIMSPADGADASELMPIVDPANLGKTIVSMMQKAVI